MRVLIVIMTTFLMQVSASTRAQQFSLKRNSISLKQIFVQIRKQTGYTVLYESNLINRVKPLRVDLDEVPIEDALKEILAGKNLDYSIKNKAIIISKKEQPSFIDRVIDAFNAIDIRGKVMDQNGSPLAGASVKVVGGKTITTNQAGEFYIPGVDEGAVIEISFVGYKSVKVKAVKDLGLISLLLNDSELDQVQIIGYGTTTKRLNTGAVSTVKGDVIASQPVTDPLMALEGRVPGLHIAQASGVPGAGSVVMLRGKNSIANGNNPFYVVDGVPYTSASTTITYLGGGALGGVSEEGRGLSPFNFLNPSDIERIDILKDADATAIYGSRGANGVILITTKKGSAGKTKFDLNASTGAGRVTNMLDLMNTQEYLAMRQEAFKNDGKKPVAADYDVNGTWDQSNYTDWQKLMIGGLAKLSSVQAGLSGGNGNTQFALRGGFSNQTTVFPGDYSDRKASALLNVSHASADNRFHAVISASYLNDVNKIPQTDFTRSITIAPNAPTVYDASGNLNWGNNTFANPLANTKRFTKATTNNLIGNLELNYQLLPDLVIKSGFGYNRLETVQTDQTPITAFSPASADLSSARTNNYGNNLLNSWIIEPQLTYSKTIGEGSFSVLVGSTFQQNRQNYVGYNASDFASDAMISNIAMAGSVKVIGINYTQYNYNAIFGRINYNWKEKYILNLTARRDGSSRFGPGKQFGNFGAVGAAWIFSEDHWIKEKLFFLSFGKIRASYGITGNDQIPDYQYLSTYGTNYKDYQGLTGLMPMRIANADFSWEEVTKAELGLETGFLDNRILFGIDFYRNRSNNQLVGYSLPSTTGFTSVQYNLPALVQNSGVEMELSSVNIKSGNFSWKTSANITIPRNKLLKYPAIEASTSSFAYVVGESILGRRLLNYTGVDPQTGLYTVKDVNDDQVINRDDYTNYRLITQDCYGGLQNSFSYKGIQADVFFQFVKQDGYDFFNKAGALVGARNKNFPSYIIDRTWHATGDQAEYQRFTTVTNQTAQPYAWRNDSDGAVVDASFIRLKSVMLSYALSEKIVSKLGLRNLKVYMAGQNLLTFTSFKGLDPESKGGLTLPPLRMITGGIQLAL